jgi:hypothetical protein
MSSLEARTVVDGGATALSARTVSQGDGSGGATAFWVDDTLRDDYYSAVARSDRVLDRMETFLGGEVYHWHHKLMIKRVSADGLPGGAFRWHQDFGYWHETGRCLFPWMASCMVAVTRTTKANGCLQVL